MLLSDALPILENMGLQVLSEEPQPDPRRATGALLAARFRPAAAGRRPVDVDAVRERFQDLFAGVWAGRLENDGFNRLVLAAGLEPAPDHRRCAPTAKYILQIGTPVQPEPISSRR